MSRVLIPLFLLIILLGGGGYFLLNNQKMYSPVPIPLPQGNVCDADAMVCEDGTVLKRQGPNCDFPPCPSSNSASSTVSATVPSPTPIPSATGEDITISGTMICLPHKNTNGPQTLECAFGLKGDDGNNYGLSDPGWKYLMGIGNGTRVKITGKLNKQSLIPIENKKQDTKYDSIGAITIETLTKI